MTDFANKWTSGVITDDFSLATFLFRELHSQIFQQHICLLYTRARTHMNHAGDGEYINRQGILSMLLARMKHSLGYFRESGNHLPHSTEGAIARAALYLTSMAFPTAALITAGVLV